MTKITPTIAVAAISLAAAIPAFAQCPIGQVCVTDVPVVAGIGPNCLDFTMKGKLYSLPYDHFNTAAGVLIGNDIRDHANMQALLTIVFSSNSNDEPCGYPQGQFPTAINAVVD